MADQKSKYTYSLIDPDDIKEVIATEYLIDDFLVLGDITFVFVAPNQFKTFLILAALLCVALGRDFFARKVAQRKVLYLIGEGGDAFIGRIKAWQALNNVLELNKNFLVLPRTVNLFDDNDVKKAVAEVKAQGFHPDVVCSIRLGAQWAMPTRRPRTSIKFSPTAIGFVRNTGLDCRRSWCRTPRRASWCSGGRK